MKSFSAIVVIALCLSDTIHSRGINTGELCSKEEFQCDKTNCIKQIQICDKTADCKDGSDESGCECLLKGQLSCEVQGRCIEKEKLCNGDPCPNMKGNLTCPEVLQGSASAISESTANDSVNIATMGTNNMTLSDIKVNMTMKDKKSNMTMENQMANMTIEDKKEKANMTMKDKMTNMTMEDKKANMTMEDKKANKTRENKMTNMTKEGLMANMTMKEKKASMTVTHSGNFNATINKPVESKNNMTLNDTMIMSNGNKSMDISNATAKSDANSAMKKIAFDYGNSSEVFFNATEFDTTTTSESIDVATMENANSTMEGDMLELNFTNYDTNDNETEGCSMSDSIACEEFDPPCISAISYCNYSAQCPSQNRSKVCGDDNVPLPMRKAKLTNLRDYHESEEKNFVNSTRESSNEEHATKESLKVTESENEGDNHLKIIIPVAVIGGLCLVAIIIWFVTRRKKNVDSYALQ